MDGLLKFNINNCRSLKQDELDRQENLRKCYRKTVADPAITCPFEKVLQDIFNGMIGSSKETHYNIARKYFTVVKKPSELKSSVQLFLFVDEKRRDIPESNLYRDAKLHFSQEDPAFLLTAIVLLARCPVPPKK